MKIFIKYMIDVKSKLLVRKELEKLKIAFIFIDMGVVELASDLTFIQKKHFKENLLKCGLKLQEHKKELLIKKIQNSVLEMLQDFEKQRIINYSHHLSEELDYDYTYLANIFSEEEGISIQQYIILNKIKIVQGLIAQGNLNLTEIAHKLNYSSVAHLSGQFKKVTGLTPTQFKVKSQNKIST